MCFGFPNKLSQLVQFKGKHAAKGFNGGSFFIASLRGGEGSDLVGRPRLGRDAARAFCVRQIYGVVRAFFSFSLAL